MKAAALVANIGLFLVFCWYLLTEGSFEAEGVEWVVLVLALAGPVVSVVALARGPARGGSARAVAVIANIGLLAAPVVRCSWRKMQNLCCARSCFGNW